MKTVLETSIYLLLMATISFISVQFIVMNQRVTQVSEVTGYLENYMEASGTCKVDDSVRQMYYTPDGVASVKTLGRISLGENKADATHNSIIFTIKDGTKADIKLFSLSCSSTDSTIGVYKDGTLIKSGISKGDNGNIGDIKNPISVTLELKDLTPGTYYIGNENGASDIYYAEVVEKYDNNVLNYVLTSEAIDKYFSLTTNVVDMKGNYIYYRYNDNKELVLATAEDIKSEDIKTFPILTDEIKKGLFDIADKYGYKLSIEYLDVTNNYVYIDYKLTYGLEHPMLGFAKEHTYTGLFRFYVFE